ncbi:MAG: hypothetical protein ACI8RD_014482, partial [Bacillariaceae sp.]|jgi:hypothetical protein
VFSVNGNEDGTQPITSYTHHNIHSVKLSLSEIISSFGWYAILRMASISCDAVWLAWLQLSCGAIVFNILASNGALLVLLSVMTVA